MCLAIPARITRINGLEATADLSGVAVEVSLALLPDTQVGDYVVLHVGYALSRIDPVEAEASLAALGALATLEEARV
jgi:hydrogenase expression/formation protein HypC